MAKTRGTVTFDENYCKGCSLCVAACPVHILELDSKRLTAKGYHPAVVTDMNSCTACASCALMCPDSAITIEKTEEAAL